MTFTLFKFLHILTMFGAVAATTLPEVVLHRVGASGSVPAIRVFAAIAAGASRMLPVLFIGGALFGLLAAWTGEMDFFKPWLIGAYIVFVIAMITGATITGPWTGRVQQAADASGTEAVSPDLRATLHEGRAMAGSVVLLLAIVVIIFLMVFKPGN
jgi:hypothetical protein